MFSDASDRMPRNVRMAKDTTTMTSFVATGSLPPWGRRAVDVLTVSFFDFRYPDAAGCVADGLRPRDRAGRRLGYRRSASSCISANARRSVRTVMSHSRAVPADCPLGSLSR